MQHYILLISLATHSVSPFQADISCLAEVGEELDEGKKDEKVARKQEIKAEEEKTKVKESDKAKPKEKTTIKKEGEEQVERC